MKKHTQKKFKKLSQQPVAQLQGPKPPVQWLGFYE